LSSALQGSDTPIRDVLLPDSDRTALIQVIVVIVAIVVATYLVRRERALVQFVIGIGALVLGLMATRTLH
jgi:hypothetical protein